MKKNLQRINEIDGLRGLASLAVVFYHYFYMYEQLFGHNFQVWSAFRLGFYGVHLFFIISGFVIFWTISKTEKPFDFIWLRFSRLYPVYWVSVCITFTFILVFQQAEISLTPYQFLLNLTMIQEYFKIKHVDGAYWTLTLELAFYFWILLIFKYNQLNNIESLLSIWVVSSIILLNTGFPFQQSIILTKLFLLEYIQLFAAGICFYKIWKEQQNKKTNILLLLCLLSNFLQNPFLVFVIITIIHIIFYLAIKGKLKFLSSKIFVFLGSISYALYLVHQNIGYIIIKASYNMHINPFWGILFAFFLSLSLAYFITRYVEKPSLKYLKKLKIRN